MAKRWMLGTHQGSVDDAHLPSYLNEFVFRFNRRHSRSRGMVFYRVLELAVGHDPVRYRDIIAGRRPRAVPPTPPQARGQPTSLERPAADRPAASQDIQQLRRCNCVRPGPAGQLELEGCDDSMKCCLLSRGCESRPARGEPARAGSEPCDVLGNEVGDA